MEPKGFRRKFTAILIADVAGYSRLTVATPESYKQASFDLNTPGPVVGWGSVLMRSSAFFVAGGPSRAAFLDYLTEGALIWGFQI